MKKILLTMVCLSVLYSQLRAQMQTLAAPAAKSMSEQQVPGDWYNNAKDWLAAQQENFRKLDVNTYGVINSDNQFGCIITPSGYTVKNISSGNGEDWQSSFELLTLNNNPLGTEATAEASGKKLAFERPDITVEYLNGKQGMRQNFIINEKPVAVSGLALAIKISTRLNASVNKNRLALKNGDGQVKLMYDELMVYDARHKLLPAEMSLDGNTLIITVNDAAAQYPVTIDPLNHTPDWNDNGNGLVLPLLNDLTAHVLFGFSVSNAGDVNGDGYGDIIIGAPGYVDIISVSAGTFNLVSVGAAFVYYGSASGLSATPNEVLQPTTQAGALMGYSVSGSGDVNGDGYKDVVVGAPGDRITLNVGVIPVATSVAAGKVYVYYGGPSGTFDGNVNTEPTVSATLNLRQSDFGALLSVPACPMYGFSVNIAGDVNGDGRSDLLVGVPAYVRLLPTPLLGGRVDIYYGTLTGVSTGSMSTVTGITLNGLFGYSVSTAGNVNNDKNAGRNIDDIIVGAPGNLTFLGAGSAFVFNGSTSGITATSASGASISLSDGLLTTLFGYSVSNAGDINGDGYGDVLVGEPAALENILSQLVSVGAVHVYYGSAGGVTTTGNITLNSVHRPSVVGMIEGNLLYGFSVKAAGDVNCDGVSDIVVGEPGGTALSLGSGLLGLVSTNSVSGRTYIYFGVAGVGVNSTPGYTIEESGAISAANFIGYAVSAAGDINNDGRQDILVGAPNGTIDLSGAIMPLVGNALSIVTTNSVGSSYVYNGCLSAIILPLLLTDFSAQKTGGSVSVTWMTEKESSISHYILEYSTDGANFSSMAIQFPQNNNSNSYSFNHTTPAPVNYYRLKIVDANGQYKYSDIRVVRFDKNGKETASVYPNPAKGSFALQLDHFEKGKYTVNIIGVTGQVLQTTSLTIDKDHFEERINASMLKQGSYRIVLVGNNGKQTNAAQVFIGQ